MIDSNPLGVRVRVRVRVKVRVILILFSLGELFADENQDLLIIY